MAHHRPTEPSEPPIVRTTRQAGEAPKASAEDMTLIRNRASNVPGQRQMNWHTIANACRDRTLWYTDGRSIRTLRIAVSTHYPATFRIVDLKAGTFTTSVVGDVVQS
jgi:hypothetical protein